MKNLPDFLSGGFRFITGDVATIAILVAVLAVSFFAFVLEAEIELICCLLILGIVTALVESVLHARVHK